MNRPENESLTEGKPNVLGRNALRAGVLGANDGLVSILSLVMGIAGATVGGREVLIAGIAGVTAGAFSMALGEWISVKSSHEMTGPLPVGGERTPLLKSASPAWEAALFSFLFFAVGGSVPVVPFFFTGGEKGILLSLGLSIVALFVLGSAITLITGRPFLKSGMRQVMFGLGAAAITFGIGRVIGISIS
ncbi:MAG TPA: VIT1/CCC1 transporter family protein [Bacteroidales bacterium]|nr:VIT1/CCC1 transporter family protein [Bacteroidales bacterium]